MRKFEAIWHNRSGWYLSTPWHAKVAATNDPRGNRPTISGIKVNISIIE